MTDAVASFLFNKTTPSCTHSAKVAQRTEWQSLSTEATSSARINVLKTLLI